MKSHNVTHTTALMTKRNTEEYGFHCHSSVEATDSAGNGGYQNGMLPVIASRRADRPLVKQ